MKKLIKHLDKLKNVERRKHHPLIHKIHKEYGISRKTLLYVKEYGPHTNVPRNIIKESIKILLLASILSSIGGFALENVKESFITIVPIIILLPVLNDMIGNYGTIISSRFSTLLCEMKISEKWNRDADVRVLFFQVLIVSFVMAAASSLVALICSVAIGYPLTAWTAYKIIMIGVIDMAFLVNVLFLIAVLAGIHFFRKNEDPSNFLIPITTSVADIGNMVLLSVLLVTFF